MFPEGKISRSGDIYAWALIISKLGGIYWSPHIGSITYRDSPNMTSKTEVPSILLNNQMLDEISKVASQKELYYTKIYANRLIKRAYFEQKRFKKKTQNKSLAQLFYWENNISFCLIWSLTSLLPDFFVSTLRKVKLRFKL